MDLNIVGISAYYHDSACCIIQNGDLIAAAQEERFSRRKNDPDLPEDSFLFCLQKAGLSISDIDCIAFYEDPEKKFARQQWSRSEHLPIENTNAIYPHNVEKDLREGLGFEGPIKFYDHHLSHAASAFLYSGYDRSAIMTVDGVGEWATTTYGIGEGKKIKTLEEVMFPDSIGLLYATITNYLGFHINSDEYKVMGLAPYGVPVYTEKIRELIQLAPAGQFSLTKKYFNFMGVDKMYTDALADLFGCAPRKHESDIKQVYKDIAKSLQVVLEEILLSKVNYLHETTGVENLCMAGGVALNCVANGHVLRHGKFRRLFVQPAANDAGCALGAAALAQVELADQFVNKPLKHVYLGPEYDSSEIEQMLRSTSIKYKSYVGKTDELLNITAHQIARGKVIGWFQGRMEFGPRALGARSILADPRDGMMRDRINAMVKKRESFRPFAPSILDHELQNHFALDHPSPFMLETCQVCSPLDLPAITHVDNSARVQTVDEETNPRFAALLKSFARLTGCPILLNTSFNVRGEPIVCTPEDALVCFAVSEIDCLVIGDFYVDSMDNDKSLLATVHRNIAKRNEDTINHNVYTFI